MTVSTGTCTGEITFKVAKAPLEVAYCHILVFYYRYEYIAVYDTDEVIVPRHHTNWADLGKDLKKSVPKCGIFVLFLASGPIGHWGPF